MYIRVYNYNTTERIKAFEAHQDYIRSLAVHPTLPYVLSASDDMTIKLWDWDKGVCFFCRARVCMCRCVRSPATLTWHCFPDHGGFASTVYGMLQVGIVCKHSKATVTT